MYYGERLQGGSTDVQEGENGRKNPYQTNITKSMVMGRWGICREEMYHFSRAAVSGGMQAGKW